MRIVVCVQEAIRSWTREIIPERTFTGTGGQEAMLSPRDEVALEHALSLRERYGGEVTAITAGRAEAEETVVREALAMGADYGILVIDPSFAEGTRVARLLAWALAQIEYDLVLMGPGRLESSTGQTPPSVAAALGLPVQTAAIDLRLSPLAGSTLLVRRAGREGREEEVEVCLPAVIGVAAGSKQPRTTSLKGVMRARQTSIQILQPS